MTLLGTITQKTTMRDLLEVFCAADIYPVRRDWQVSDLPTHTEARETTLNPATLPGKVYLHIPCYYFWLVS